QRLILQVKLFRSILISTMESLLLVAEQAGRSASSFGPIALQLFIAIGFVAIMMIASHLLGPRRNTAEKLINYESGIPSVGNARQPVAVKYFLVAILFVLFDVVVIFFYLYAVNFKELGTEGFMAVLLFVALFFTGNFKVI